MLCTPSHKWWTFTVIALARYLTRALGYEPLEPNLTGIQENSSREMKLVGQLSIPSSFGLHLMPAGNQSRLGSVQFWEMRGGRSTCSSCSKAKANEKKNSEIYHHRWQAQGVGLGGWKRAAKSNDIAGESPAPYLCLRACQTGLRLDKGLNGQGLGSAGTGPQACFHLWEMKRYGFCDSLTHLQGQTITKATCLAAIGHRKGAWDLDGCVPLALGTAPEGTVRFRYL